MNEQSLNLLAAMICRYSDTKDSPETVFKALFSTGRSTGDPVEPKYYPIALENYSAKEQAIALRDYVQEASELPGWCHSDTKLACERIMPTVLSNLADYAVVLESNLPKSTVTGLLVSRRQRIREVI